MGQHRRGGRLSIRQRLFVAEYLKRHDATAAARAAGYSSHTATGQGSRLLRNAHVAAAVEDGERALLAKIEMSAEEVIRELSLIARARVIDAHNEDWTAKAPSELSEELRAGLSRIRVRETIAEEAEGEGRRVVLHRSIDFGVEKGKALELLAKRHGLLVDRVEGSVRVAVATGVTEDEWRELARLRHAVRAKRGAP